MFFLPYVHYVHYIVCPYSGKSLSSCVSHTKINTWYIPLVTALVSFMPQHLEELQLTFKSLELLTLDV